MNFAVFVSGNGTNLQAIINAIKKKVIKAHLALVVCDNSKAFALKRAQKANIKSVFVNPKAFADRVSFDKDLITHLKIEKIDFIVLAGFMRIFSPYFIKRYKNKILNIHPSLLPAFKGAHAIKDAFNYGSKVTGVTVHFVDEKVDHGPIIMQEMLVISPKDTLRKLEERIHKIEHKLYPKVIDLYVRGKLRVKGRKVLINVSST